MLSHIYDSGSGGCNSLVPVSRLLAAEARVLQPLPGAAPASGSGSPWQVPNGKGPFYKLFTGSKPVVRPLIRLSHPLPWYTLPRDDAWKQVTLCRR